MAIINTLWADFGSGTDHALICLGLELETGVATRHFTTADGGIGCANLAHRLERAREAGCRGLVSLGLAGGLCDELSAGDVVVASEVIIAQGRFATDDRWAAELLWALPAAIYGPVAGSDVAITTVGSRRELAQWSGAMAVDMESHLVARAAAAYRMRFVALRVVIDAVNRRVPEAALGCVSCRGETTLSRLGQLLLRRPQDVTAVLRLCADWPRARRSLNECCKALLGCAAAIEAGESRDL